MTSASEHKELKAKWKNEVEVSTYKKQDVQKHNSKKDLWVIIHGKVYDVTEYANDHPGGMDLLLEVAGTDATSAYEDVGHSEDAREILHTYLKGVLDGANQDSDTKSSTPLPSVQIVRRHDTDKSITSTEHGHKSLIISAFAAGTTALVYLGTSFSSSLPVRHGGRGFTDGFLAASAVIGVTGIVGARYLSSVMGPSRSFDSYPSYVRSSEVQGSTFRPTGVLNPSEYRNFELRSKDELSDGVYRFVFNLPNKYSILGLPIGQHIAIKATIDDHTVVRSYTPISSNRDLGRLDLLIRVYPDGQVGNYLKNLKIGDSAQIRGPKGAMKYRRDMSQKIGMVGGGTGITPLFQLIRAICEDKNDNTEISLIYGNRSESDIMLKDRLDHYAKTYPRKFKVLYTLDKPGPSWNGRRGYVTKELLKEHMPEPSSDSTKVLLCGPPGMVSAMKTNLVELGFEKPGAVSKMSDQIFCF